jgi:anti-sigma factor RsiW
MNPDGMRCDEVGERLVDGWDRTLGEDERAELEEHLAGCPACRDEARQLEALWARLGGIEPAIEVPSQRLRARFYSFLAEEERRHRAGRWSDRLGRRLAALWPRERQAQMALAAASLVLGVGVGLAGAGLGTGAEVRALRGELASVSESVGLSLLTHPAATERLRGVSLAGRAAADQRVVEALVDVVRSDPNDNVRLAAIEALAQRLDEPGVGPRLLEVLPVQSSPLLQMTLLEVLLPQNGPQVLEVAEPLLEAKGQSA